MNEWGLTSPSTHFGDESFQSVTCTGTDKLNRSIKRQNTNKHIITQQKKSLMNSTKHIEKKPRLKERSDRAWFSRLL